MTRDSSEFYKSRFNKTDPLVYEKSPWLILDGLSSSTSKCVSSRQCAAGFGCVNGVCVRISAQGLNGSRDSAGSCNNYPYFNPCNSGSRACSDNGTCGSGSPTQSCCGNRVSYRRRDSNGNFIPSCETYRSEERRPGCRPFCSNYFALFNTIAAGCEGYDPCFPDCETCGIDGIRDETDSGYACQPAPIEEDTPCYCDSGARCNDCEKCITDVSDFRYGECVVFPENKRCVKCLGLESHTCCEVDVGPIRVCEDGSNRPLQELFEEELANRCEKACNDCEKAQYVTICSPEGVAAGTVCPIGKQCTVESTTTQGGLTCTTTKIVDGSKCCLLYPLVCNSHLDCAPGFECTGDACVEPSPPEPEP